MSNVSTNHDDRWIQTPLISPAEWGLDPDLIFLNHGSFGACPLGIRSLQQQVLDQLERSPVRFMLEKLPQLLGQAREAMSHFLNADPEGLIFVSNASEGVMTALSSISWRAGDEIILSHDSYPACRHMLTVLAERYGLVLKVAKTPFGGDPSTWANEVLRSFDAERSPRTRLALIDHITSPTALIFPAQELVHWARGHGILSLVDGAHAPGQLEVNLLELAPDFYTGNAHKWLMSPKSSAVLYCGPELRHQLQPLVISHGYLAHEADRFHALFDWTGTRDYSATCVLPDTLSWIPEKGLTWGDLRLRNQQLTRSARELISQTLWGDSLPPLPPHSVIAQMAAIPLPPPLGDRARLETQGTHRVKSAAASAPLHPLQAWLNREGFEVPIIETVHGTFLRISAQAYNSFNQYEALSDRLNHALQSGIR